MTVTGRSAVELPSPASGSQVNVELQGGKPSPKCKRGAEKHSAEKTNPPLIEGRAKRVRKLTEKAEAFVKLKWVTTGVYRQTSH